MTAFWYKVVRNGDVIDARHYFWNSFQVVKYIVPRLTTTNGFSKNYTFMAGAQLYFQEELFKLIFTTPVSVVDYSKVETEIRTVLGKKWTGNL